MFAIRIVKRYSDGAEAAKLIAIVALCSYEGFISEGRHKIKLECNAERPFLTLNNASDLLQMVIVRLVQLGKGFHVFSEPKVQRKSQPKAG